MAITYYSITLWKNAKTNEDTKRHFKEITTFAEKSGYGITQYSLTVEPVQTAPQEAEPQGEGESN